MTRLLTRRTTAALTALVAGIAAMSGAAPASAADPVLASVTLRPITQAGLPLTGPFTVTADVAMNDSAQVSITPGALVFNNAMLWSRMTYLPAKTVTPAECPTSCIVEWTVDPTTQAAAWPTTAHVSVLTQVSTDGADPVPIPAVGAEFQSPVADIKGSTKDLERPASTITADYLPGVLHASGTANVTSPTPRATGESLRASLQTIPRSGTPAVEVASAAGTWGAADPVTGTTPGSVTVNTSAVAEGSYQLYVQGRTAAGQWGWPRYLGQVMVRHQPVVTTWPISPVLVGSPISTTLALRGPWLGGYNATGIRTRVDGGAPVTSPFGDYGGNDVAKYTAVTVPADRLPLGTHVLTVEVVDPDGQRIGAAQTITVPVVTFTETVSHGPLVVGQQVPVTVKGTAPAGLTYDSCDFAFYDAQGLNNTTSRTVCFNPQKSFTTTTNPIVRVAGPARFELIPQTTSGLSMKRTFPVTVYAARAVSLSAPSSSAYGAKATATIKVTDRTDAARAAVARSGVTVTLQRKVAGTSSWVSLGSARTDSYGKAAIAFANTANGRLRVVATSSVPGRTVVSAERAVTSVSTVAWSSLPTWARSGSLIYAKVYAKPYEKGAYVRVQARLKGTSPWRTYGTAYVSSTGYAKPAMRLYTRGTWEVRVVRVATTLRASGYSTVRRVTVG